MIFTVLLDIQTNLLVGHVMALSAWRQTWGREVPPFNRWFARAMAWSAGCFVPVAGYFYYAFPDWSLVYMTDPAGVPGWFGPCVFLGYAGGMFFGYLVAQQLLSRRMLGAFLGSTAYALLLNVAMFVATWDQYTHIGSLADYRAGTAAPIFGDAAFMLRMNVGGAVMVLGAVAVIAWNLRERPPEGGGADPAAE